MPSRPMTRAQIIDQAENYLQSTTWGATELGLLLDDVLTEVSWAIPYMMRDVYQLETRTGTSTSTSSNNLVDATESQFLSTDTGKVIYNTDDKTWAVITSYSSTSQVGLSKDIFTVGEGYEIYNEGCWASNQVNINNSNDFLWIVKACYPVDRAIYNQESPRNWNLIRRNEFDSILELDIASWDDTKDTTADKDVYVYLAKQHKLNSMTTLTGEIDLGAGYAAGTTTVHVDGLANETIYKDTLLYFAQMGGVTVDSRNIYRVTTDVTAASNEADIIITPGLESALVDNDDVVFIRSTLTPDLEQIVVQILIGEALMARSIKNIDNIVTGEGVSQKQFQTGERIAEKARTKLHRKVDVNLKADRVYGR